MTFFLMTCSGLLDDFDGDKSLNLEAQRLRRRSFQVSPDMVNKGGVRDEVCLWCRGDELSRREGTKKAFPPRCEFAKRERCACSYS